tara:strand:+ start:402 stop:1352 length:951 start_codon:yes stop_codon:yes gene_type:complete
MNITLPQKQIKLYEFKNLFTLFANLYKKNKLPHVVMLTGPQGIGKATFAYHLINFILSENEKKSYSFENYEIDPNNSSFNLIQENIHPNFFKLDVDNDSEIIKIEQIRILLKFLNKSSYSKNLKIVLIDNAEYLNINSSNALLKSLEESSSNTFFFIINNESHQVIETIKSRAIQFNFHLNLSQKINVYKSICGKINSEYTDEDVENFLYFETPGNLVKYQYLFEENNLNIFKDIYQCILFLIDKYKSKKNNEMLRLLTLLIEKYYNNLSISNFSEVNTHYINKNKISILINDMKKFNLDKKNTFFNISEILYNEI